MRSVQPARGGALGSPRRKAAVVVTCAALAAGLGASPAAQASPRDNLANARLCLNGGWKTLKMLDGRSFRNQGLCIVYALFGGRFAPPPSPTGGGGE